MPKDVVYGLPIMTVLGNVEFYIENFRGIIEYTETIIKIQTKIGRIIVHGRKLQVEHYTNEDMKITGHFLSIEFHSEG